MSETTVNEAADNETNVTIEGDAVINQAEDGGGVDNEAGAEDTAQEDGE